MQFYIGKFCIFMDFQFGSWKEGGNVRMVKHVVVIWDKKMVEGEMPTALSKQPAMELDASKPHTCKMEHHFS